METEKEIGFKIEYDGVWRGLYKYRLYDLEGNPIRKKEDRMDSFRFKTREQAEKFGRKWLKKQVKKNGLNFNEGEIVKEWC